MKRRPSALSYRPSAEGCERLAGELREAGEVAASIFAEELRAQGWAGDVSCDFLGQAKSGDDSSHETDPTLWVVAPGSQRSQATVCYMWTLFGNHQFVQGGVRANNAKGRGVPLSEVRCFSLWKQLEQAAVDSQDESRAMTKELCDVELGCRCLLFLF